MNVILRVTLVLFFAWVSPAFAEENPGVSWSWSTSVSSKYMCKIGLVCYNGPTMFNELSASSGDWTGGVLTSTSIIDGAEYNTTFADEWDVYGVWSHTYDAVRLKLVGSYFVLKNLEHTNDDVWIVEGEIGFPKFPFAKPYVSVRRFGEVGPSSPSNGLFVWTGATRSQPLGIQVAEHKLKVDFNLFFGWSDGALGRDSGLVFGRLVTGIPVQFGKNVIVTPSVLYQVPIGGQKTATKAFTREEELVGSLAVKFSF